MTTESTSTDLERHTPKAVRTGGSSGDAFYGIGLFGAWVYFIGRATTNQERVLGFLKGIVWPAFLVYGAMKFLGM